MITFLVILCIVLAFCGVPIFAAMAALGALGLAAADPGGFLATSSGGLVNVLKLGTSSEAQTLSTIPLFIFAGYVMAEAGTARRLVDFAKALVGWVPGGLALVTIVACAIFTTFTGASGVTIVAIGGMLLPALRQDGYGEKFSLGLITGTGSVGLLFPPALPLIVYGVVYGMSAQAAAASGDGESMTLVDFRVEKFLFAGIVPGLVLIGIIGAYCVYAAIRDKVPRTKFDGAGAIKATIKALPELAIPVLVIASLATGTLVIPEAAAFTALYVLVVEMLLYRDVKLRQLPKLTREALGLVGAIFIIILAANFLTAYFINDRIPEKLFTFVDRHIDNKWTFLLALNLLLLVVGCLMDIFSAIVVVVPLIVPAALAYGVDPYHLGVIFLLNLEIGYLTPPVGLNLFITSFRFEKPMTQVYLASFPFLCLMLVALVIVTYVPALTVVPKGDEQGQIDTAAPPTADGEVTEITLPDGKLLKRSDCDVLGDADPVAKIECELKFTNWPKCAELPALEKIECEQKVAAGEDPFAGTEEEETDEGADAGGDDWGEEEEPAAPDADAAAPDAGAAAPAEAEETDDWE